MNSSNYFKTFHKYYLRVTAVVICVCIFLLLIFYEQSVNDKFATKHDLERILMNIVNDSMLQRFSQRAKTLPESVLNLVEYCPPTPPNLRGEFELDLKNESLEIVDRRLGFSLKPGGWFAPKECKPRDRVAIVVPMKNRLFQLPTFLKNIHPMLMRQQIEYAIYIVEQTNDQPDFNKGALFNAGFKEALKMYDWDCFIFHDIDTIPFDDRHIYKCPRKGPLHMGVALDKFNYT